MNANGDELGVKLKGCTLSERIPFFFFCNIRKLGVFVFRLSFFDMLATVMLVHRVGNKRLIRIIDELDYLTIDRETFF